jgi:hypothetical protein
MILNQKKIVSRETVNNKFTGFYFPIYLNSEYGFYSVNNGFALEKVSEIKRNKINSQLIFRKSQAFNNDKGIDLYSGIEIPFRFNNGISFILPNESDVQYQYFLEGFSENWSVFSKKMN